MSTASEKKALMLMGEDAKKPQYKYVLQFPNKFRVYSNDDQFLLTILEKYGTSGPVVVHYKGSDQSKRAREICPECQSRKFVWDKERSVTICMNCGFILNNRKLIEYFDAPPLTNI